ncbi:hypothetical protein ACFVH9_08350 [Streptomyces hirsutus]|uniref:hypothetical protein n=1 Tax=Streptomyces hirsutus TaxID=35620 RepID=UPI00362C4041
MTATTNLPLGFAREIARLSPENQNLLTARWARGGFKDAGHAERYAKAIRRDEATRF